MPRRRFAVALAAALCGAIGAGAGLGAGSALANDAGSITHASGNVSATVAWDRADYGIANPRLFVVREGVRYDLTITDVCQEGCILVPDDGNEDPAGTSMVKVADLDGDGEPEVLVDTFSGGAHCCLTARLLTWNGTGYTPKDIEYRDVGYALKDADGDGRPELVGYDPVFSGAFTAFAGSAFPPQVLQVDHGKVVDVTRKFPKLIRADAAARRRELRAAKRGDDVRGVLAAYVADEYLLGKGATGVKEIDRLRRKGLISTSFKPYLLKRLKAWKYR
ncbi:MAG TPA: hypothetical protein VNT03_12650 [Baekduia sp.]|nr:hypothetical protein [Baekduia sp.]